MAFPLASARLTLTGVVLTLLSPTVKTACASVPSVTVGLLTLSAGVSLSVPPAPVPSSWIVPMPAPSAMLALVGALSVIVKASLCSKTASSEIASVIVWLNTPGAKISVPVSGSTPAA